MSVIFGNFPVLKLRSFFSRRPKQRNIQVAKRVRGNLDFQPISETLICGWAAEIGDDSARTVILHIDDAQFSLKCADYRVDLERAGINTGHHAFTFAVPIEFADAQPHQVKLVDKATGDLLSHGVTSWSRPRDFTDFDGFLKASLVAPLLRAPFREEDKRVFAFSENLADDLAESVPVTPVRTLVSVIMPVYNRASTVSDAIRSVLGQRYRDFELIIVDDGSTDNSLDVISSFNDFRITLVCLEKNRGVSSARNIGLQKAHGEYVAYLDSDNSWDERYLAVMISVITSTQSIGAYCGQWLYKGNELAPFSARFGAFNKSLIENRNYVDLNAFIHRTDAGVAVGNFDESLRRFVDWDLILRLSDHGKIVSVPVFLSRYFYEKAPNTLTNDSALRDDFNVVRVKREFSRSAMIGRPRLSGLETLRTKLGKPVTVIIPSYEALTDLRDCLDAIDRCCYRKQLHVIVVDNASSPEVVAYLNQKVSEGRVTAVFNERNFGFSTAVNQGLAKRTEGSDVLLLNNDAVVSPDAISLMQQSVALLPKAGIIVPQQVLYGGTRTMSAHVPYADPHFECDVNISMHHRNVLSVGMFHAGDTLSLSFAPFFAAYLPAETLVSRSYLDAEFGRHYRSDHTYCAYVRHVLKKKIYHVSDAVVYHKLQRATEQLITRAGKHEIYRKMIELNQWEPEEQEASQYRQAEWDK